MKKHLAASNWLTGIWWVFILLLSIALVFSGYGGIINPDTSTLGALMLMAFPIFLVSSIIALFAAFWISKWSMIPLGLAMLACMGPILDFSPLNISSKEITPQEKERSFSLLSYNVYAFEPYDGNYRSDSINQTLSYIIKANADIACLEECEFMSELPSHRVFQSQVDSIEAIYPHRYIDPRGNSILSKYPFERIKLHDKGHFKGRIAAYRVNVKGKPITIFEVHMTSIGLTADDKTLYRSVSELDMESDFGLIKRNLVGKLSAAFRERAEQARVLRELINEIGGENVIVCGDFNDVAGSYAYLTICGDDMRDVYCEVGFGPMITYFVNRFYFRIDHILYKGDFKPAWFECGDFKMSDHYPLMTEFVWND